MVTNEVENLKSKVKALKKRVIELAEAANKNIELA